MYSSSQAVVMYASPGSSCTLAPVVPILNVPPGGVGCGTSGEADTDAPVANASAARLKNRSGRSLRGCSTRCTCLLPLTSATDHKSLLQVNRRRSLSVEVVPGDGSDAGRPVPRARSRPFLVGARPARAGADEARPPAAPVPREVRADARR